ncbi:hypothetical protein JCM3766R1_006232 [Sporobolomyces carnicolor]
MLRLIAASTRTLRQPLLRRPLSTSNYIASLRQRYPSADPPSLVISFLILHELTAIAPLALLFGAFHYLGLGAGIVAWTLAESEPTAAPQAIEPGRWTAESARLRVREWIREGEDKAERVGRRYGWFGWDKESREQREHRKARDTSRGLEADNLGVTGDVANVAAAYLVVKALLPLRLVVSLRLSPSLANLIVKRFRGLRARGTKLLKRQAER